MNTKLESLTKNLTNFSMIEQLIFEKSCKELDLEFTSENGDPNSYFTCQRYYLLTTKNFISNFKFELYYLQKLLSSLSPPPQVILSFLRTATHNFHLKCRSRLDDSHEFLKSFCEYFYTAIFGLAKICADKENFTCTEVIYDFALDFFLRQHELSYQFDFVVTILLAQADLQLIMNAKKKALDIYSNILKRCYVRLFHATELVSTDLEVNLLQTTLKKIRDAVSIEETSYFEICNSLAENIHAQTLEKLNLLAINALNTKNYLLIFNLFHIGNILLRTQGHNLNPVQITSENDLKKTLDNLYHTTCLTDAIKKYDTERAAALIANHISIYEPDDEGFYPLQLAVKLRQYSIVTALLAEDVAVDGISRTLPPPVFIAIRNKDFVMIQLLVEHEANLEILVHGKSLLYFAFKEGDEMIVNFLIKHGAKLAPREETILKNNPLFLDINNKIINEELWPKSLTLFNPKASKKVAIFCIHPVTGETSKYQLFANEINKIDPHRAVIGINSPVFLGKEPPASVAEQADLYVKIVMHLQPFGGPFILCGWSFGGLIAYEMARKLQELKQEVKLLALFDTVSPSVIKTMSTELYAKALHIYLNPCLEAFKLRSDCLPLKEALGNCPKQEQIELCISAIQKEIQNTALRMKVKKAEYKENFFSKLLAQVKINLLAALDYSPPTDKTIRMMTCFNTTMSLRLHPEDNNNNTINEDLGWSSYVQNCFTFVQDTTHVGLMMDSFSVSNLANFVANHPQLSQSDSQYYMSFHAVHLQNYQKQFFVRERVTNGHSRNQLIFAGQNTTSDDDTLNSKWKKSTYTQGLFKISNNLQVSKDNGSEQSDLSMQKS